MFFFSRSIFNMTALGIVAAVLTACGSSQEGGEGKVVKTRDQYHAETDPAVPGVDTAIQSPLYALRMMSNYQYDRGRLTSRLQRLSDPRTLEDKIELLMVRRMLGQKLEAEKGLEALLDQNPDHTQILKNLANVYLEEQRWDLAKLVLLRLLAKNKGDAALHNNMGLLLYRTGKVADAVVAWQRAVRLSQSVDARLNLGAVALAHKHFQESFNQCSEVQKLSPDDSDGWLCACVSLMGLGRFEEADSCYDIAERRFPRFEALSWNRAFAWYRTGQLKKTKSRIEDMLVTRTRSLAPDAPILQFLQQLKTEIRAVEKVPDAPTAAPPTPEEAR